MRGRKHHIDILDRDPVVDLRVCDHPDCTGSGEFRAPKSREALGDYFWFCLDHVREYNKAWNYFAGMSDVEVERIVRKDTVWDRPSWPLGRWQVQEQRIRERLWRVHAAGTGRESWNGARKDHAERERTEEEKALAVFGLEAAADFVMVKARYKALVKRHHPDANGGSRESEEALKVINQAYAVLKASFAT